MIRISPNAPRRNLASARQVTRTGAGSLYATLCLRCAFFILALAGCAAHSPRSLENVQVRTESPPRFWLAEAKKHQLLMQDGCLSILVPDGALWAFGDTFFGTRGKDGRLQFTGALSNCALHVRPTRLPDSKSCAAAIDDAFSTPSVTYLAEASGAPRPLIPYVEGEQFDKIGIWPGGGIHINGATYAFWGRVERFGTGGWDFRDAGHGLSVARGPDYVFERVAFPPDAPMPNCPAAMVDGRDGYLYLYFTQSAGFASAVYVARVAPDALADPRQWRYFAGPAAGANDADAKVSRAVAGDFPSTSTYPGAAIVDGVYAQVSVAWNPWLRAWVMLHVGSLFEKPREIFIRIAPRPEGPYSPPVSVLALDGKVGEGLRGLLYCAYLHPELFRGGGRIMPFTYCTIGEEDVPRYAEIHLKEKSNKRRAGY